jgi:hypothetical protein
MSETISEETPQIKDIGDIWVSPDGNDANDGTYQHPLETLDMALMFAEPGTKIKLKDGSYTSKTTVSTSGSMLKPIVIEAEHYQRAIFSGSNHLFMSFSAGTRFITLRGLWFKDCPLINNLYESTVVSPGENWLIEDCRFTNCASGMTIASYTTINRCIFENMGVTGIWCWADYDKLFKSPVIKDTIFRRCNTLNQDPAWGGMGAKFGFTDNLTADGLICYDNNGIGFWLDTQNVGFLVKNSSFFGQHAGMAYANFTDNKLNDTSWIGTGAVSEVNPSGSFVNNYSYKNLAAGIAVWESGNDGGIRIEGNTLADNDRCIEFRAITRAEPQRLADVSVINNRMTGWRTAAWFAASGMDTVIGKAKPGDAGFVFTSNNYYQSAGSTIFGKWLNLTANSLSQLSTIIGVDSNAVSSAFSIDAGNFTVRATTLDDVGKPSMWQVPSFVAEENNFRKALKDKPVQSIINIPVTGYKPFVKSGGKWVTEVYDLQARHIRLTADDAQKEWIENNVRPYASIMQTSIRVKLTKISEYITEAECN